ncbi:MAG: AMP-binding protein [Burkholderiaceae bacterium]
MQNKLPVAEWIAASARRTPHKAALRCNGQTLSYAALALRVEDAAAALAAAGVGRSACVAWLGRNSAEMLTMLFACARQGAMFMPQNWRMVPAEHRATLLECPPALLCVDTGFVAASADHCIAPLSTRCVSLGSVPAGWTAWDDFLAAAGHAARPGAPPDMQRPRGAPPGAQTLLLLCWTSGSTGRPKGVLLSHAAIEANADASVAMHALTPEDRVLTTLPLFHVGGLNILTTPALREGCTVTLHAKFDAAETLQAIESERITLTVLVPAQLEALLAHPRWASTDLSSLRCISTGSTLVPRRLIDVVHARGIPLIQVWGATETAPIAACLHADEAWAKAGTTGRAAAGCELRTVDALGLDTTPGACGEILVRSSCVMSGYWRAPAASAKALEGGWFHSGDIGHLDAEGFLTIDGRLSDMIISGGENISPAEIERVLLDSPDIAEAAVIGRPDARWGEAVVAVLVPRAGATLTHLQVLAFVEGRLARFKHPKHVLVVDTLPRTALGKIHKDAVRQLVAARIATPSATAEEQSA